MSAKEKPPLTAKDWPDAPEGIATDQRCVCFFGVVCEDHPDKPWEHDNCHAAGDPCPRPECPYKDDPGFNRIPHYRRVKSFITPVNAHGHRAGTREKAFILPVVLMAQLIG